MSRAVFLAAAVFGASIACGDTSAHAPERAGAHERDPNGETPDAAGEIVEASSSASEIAWADRPTQPISAAARRHVDRFLRYVSLMPDTSDLRPGAYNHVLAAYYLMARTHVLFADLERPFLDADTRATLLGQTRALVGMLMETEIGTSACAREARSSLAAFFPEPTTIRGWPFYSPSEFGPLGQGSCDGPAETFTPEPGRSNVPLMVFGGDVAFDLIAATEAALFLREGPGLIDEADAIVAWALPVMESWYGASYTTLPNGYEGYYYDEFKGPATINGVSHRRLWWSAASNSKWAAAAINFARLRAGENWGGIAFGAKRFVEQFKGGFVTTTASGSYAWPYAVDNGGSIPNDGVDYIDDLTHGAQGLYGLVWASLYDAQEIGLGYDFAVAASDRLALRKTLDVLFADGPSERVRYWIDGEIGPNGSRYGTGDRDQNYLAGEWALVALALSVDSPELAVSAIDVMEPALLPTDPADEEGLYGYYKMFYDGVAARALARSSL